MNRFLICVAVLSFMSCELPVEKKQAPQFLFKETIADGDTSIISFGRMKPLNITYDLCQQWELRNPDDANTTELTYDAKTGGHLFQEIMLYRDSSVTYNPRNGIRIGKWRLGQSDDKLLLNLLFDDGSKRAFIILQKKSNQLSLAWEDGNSRYGMQLTSDAKAHANGTNDPFHPFNNKWRVHPSKSESDSALKERMRNCIRFYALYFRDHILRNRTEINFSGLPTCFIWYRRGIGLYEADALTDDWINCFYSEKQAVEGRNIIKDLFRKYDFDWPKGTPSWFYETHSVLEQMYHKL